MSSDHVDDAPRANNKLKRQKWPDKQTNKEISFRIILITSESIAKGICL